MPDTILIVDDEIDLLHGLQRVISMEIDCRVLLAENATDALAMLEDEAIDLVLTDISMPGLDGMALLNAVKQLDPAITVVIMTAFGTIERAVEAIKAGAYEFLQKPFDEERLIHVLNKGLERNRLVRENARLLAKVCEIEPFADMVGKSKPMIDVFQSIQMLSRSEITVLILGETGTGKDCAAQAIHQLSSRRSRPMITVNCPALPENLLESELFGYTRGAFTDAHGNKRGLFEEAHGSTIFLDEIGDLSVALQTKLLRVLQDKQIQPLGALASRTIDVRIIAATNRDLKKKMKTGQFREDLYYRLNVGTINMPPLNAIKEDIPLLVEHFLKNAACESGMPPKQVSPELMDYLLARDWPGNTRELENTIRRWCAMTVKDTISIEVLAPEDRSARVLKEKADFNRPYKALKEQAIEKFTRDYLNRLLEHTKGNVSLSAQISGIKRQSLQKIIKRYNLQIEQYRN